MIRRAALTASAAMLGVAGLVSPALPASAASGTETVQILQTTDANATVIANGPLHAMGKDVQVNDTHDIFKFARGNLLITHKPTGKPRQSYDPVTCLGTFHEVGTYTVTGGTGAYAKAAGRGAYVTDGSFVQCGPKKPLILQIIKVVAKGPLSF